MTLADDIKKHAQTTFTTKWDTRDGTSVPAPSNLRLTNDAVYFKRATVLYADLDQSTSLVENHGWFFAAEVYKTFLYAASRLINNSDGTIVSYDGDRVMGVFVGSAQCNDATKCALKINYAVKNYIQPAINKQYNTSYTMRHVVGIDTSEIRVARTGVRGDNDLVWVGNSANLAAKLTAESADTPTWITDRVFDFLNKEQKICEGKDMWRPWNWTKHNNDRVYSSTYWWSF